MILVTMLRRIRNELYPPRAKEEAINPPGPFELYDAAAKRARDADSAEASHLLAQAEQAFQRERQRQESSETRAGTVISAAGIAGTLIVGAGSLVDIGSPSWIRVPIAMLYLSSLIYLALATTNALSVQRSKTRWTVGPDDIAPPKKLDISGWQRQLCEKVLRYTANNYKVNNRQMLTLERSQTFFRNAIVAAILAGLLVPLVRVTGQDSSRSSVVPPSRTAGATAPLDDLCPRFSSRRS